ncbi:fibulin-1 [Corythoichthys intestinalis]|uniref:fibulin-1 n=1 Tax=Corythoichthys intestinalis TaxID=161448 RepID=UPI0025A4E2E2|nr:fibulin-1 [Corythoichthys intestinalis]XP_057716612.1 fibulin-1 [Corythoichthys intestinalis]XP_057716618.1 fibulin-1 [Corythoichthys intestinalis]XP_061802178.1 fibulin-1-like [Nerophis lumbriciformis]
MNAQKVVLCCCWVVLFLHTCLSQKDCTGVDCPVLENCIESALDANTCCPTCRQRGCSCEGYQYYDCVQAGFREGKVPEKESYFVDFGSTECACPEGGGKISCHYIECPEISPNCIDILEFADGCPQCGQIGCTHGNKKFEAGHTFQIDQCQFCHCPNDGGKLMCSPIPDCDLQSVNKTTQAATTENNKSLADTNSHLSTTKFVQGNTLPLYKSDPPSFGTEDYDYSQAELTSFSIQNLPQPTTVPLGYPESSSTLNDDRRSALRDSQKKAETEKSTDDLRNEGPTSTTIQKETSTLQTTTAQPMTLENHRQQRKTDRNSSTRAVAHNTDLRHFHQHKQTQGSHDRNHDFTRSGRQNGQQEVSMGHMQTPNVMDRGLESTIQLRPTRMTAVRIMEDGELPPKQPQDLPNYQPQDVERELEVSVMELVEACCETGAKWAFNGHCNNMEPPTKDTQSICWTSQQQCCLGSLRERRCLAGISSARDGDKCEEDASDTCGLSSYKECCDCCSLGLKFRSKGHECKAHRHMGLHCRQAFFLCCDGMETWDESHDSSHAVKEKPALSATSPPKKVSESLYPNEAFSIGEERLGENAAEGPIEVEDIDECQIHEGNICHHRCINTPGSFRCECFPGYVLQDDAFTCAQETVDEENILKEDDRQGVEPTASFTPPTRPLVPLNPCEGNGPCDQHCIPEDGRPHCSCFPGFSLMVDKQSCQDIDECTEGSHDCMSDYECVNTEGSFMCNLKSRCSVGFERDAHGNCIDTDECQTEPCSSGFDCINTVGSYTCQRRIICGRGYHISPDRSRCIDVDECQSGAHRCGEGQLCHNLPGSYRCECQTGYQYDSFGRMCVDVNECWHYPGRLCAQTCENTPGSYQCSCTTGFRLSSDGNNCEDVNECLSSPCSQECANIYGSYQCYCRQGYFLREDGHTCEDIDECSQSIGHLCTYKCVNVPGSYQCACPESGYTMSPNGRSCRDVDECTTGAHNCSLADTCYNIQGGFRCLSLNCPPNYRKVSDTRCERISCPNYLECQNSPLRITYYYLSFQSNIVIPAQIFRIGPSPAYTGDNVIVSITKGNEEGYFSTRKLNSYTGAVYLHRQVEGPRDFLINVEMKLWRQGTFTTFHARIYVFITASSL